jgi:HK97 gp10 family phage protein
MFELNAPEIDKILKDMQELAPKLRDGALISALRKGARPIVKTAKQLVPVETGFVKKNITARANRKLINKRDGRAVSIGIRGGAKEYVDSYKNRARVIKRGKNKNQVIASRVGQEYMHGGDAFYFRFLEFGTKKMAARPFLRPAMTQNMALTTQIITAELRAAIDRIARTGK